MGKKRYIPEQIIYSQPIFFSSGVAICQSHGSGDL